MGIMIVVGVITIVVVGFSIYNWCKTIRLSRTCSNEVEDDIAVVALTVNENNLLFDEVSQEEIKCIFKSNGTALVKEKEENE